MQLRDFNLSDEYEANFANRAVGEGLIAGRFDIDEERVILIGVLASTRGPVFQCADLWKTHNDALYSHISECILVADACRRFLPTGRDHDIDEDLLPVAEPFTTRYPHEGAIARKFEASMTSLWRQANTEYATFLARARADSGIDLSFVVAKGMGDDLVVETAFRTPVNEILEIVDREFSVGTPAPGM